MIKNILVVDNEDYLREVIAMTLTELTFVVSEANSASEAITKFYELGHTFDLVITDVAMPGVSGPELIKKISSYDQNFSKVIFITGLFELPLEAKDFEKIDLKIKILFKPFLMSELVATILEMGKNKD